MDFFYFSVFLNLFTIFIVALVFYITYVSYKKKKDGTTSSSWIDAFSSPQKINKEIIDSSTQPLYSGIGNFTGQDWTDLPCNESLFGAGLPSVLIDEQQDDVSEFMDTAKPNFVGTGTGTLK